MTTKILAKRVSFADDDECTVLGFADDPNSPVSYILLQIANNPDHEEIVYGWGGVHIDTGTLGVGGYDLVQDIHKSEAGVLIRLTSDAARKAGTGQDIEIELEGDGLSGIPLDEAVRRFKDRLLSWEAMKATSKWSAGDLLLCR